jgi:hypothetical protein
MGGGGGMRGDGGGEISIINFITPPLDVSSYIIHY